MKLTKVFLLLALVGTVAFSGYANPDVKESPPYEVTIVSLQDATPVNYDLVSAAVHLAGIYVAEQTSLHAMYVGEKALVISAPDPFRKFSRRQYCKNSRWHSTKPSKGYFNDRTKIPLRILNRELET